MGRQPSADQLNMNAMVEVVKERRVGSHSCAPAAAVIDTHEGAAVSEAARWKKEDVQGMKNEARDGSGTS